VMDRNNVKGRDLARHLGVEFETVSRWRSNPNRMDSTNLVGARNYLRQWEPGLEVDDLLLIPSQNAEGDTVETLKGGK